MAVFLYTIPEIDSNNRQYITVDNLTLYKVFLKNTNKQLYKIDYQIDEFNYIGTYLFEIKDNIFYQNVKMTINDLFFEINNEQITFSDMNTDITNRLNWQDDLLMCDNYMISIKNNMFTVVKNGIILFSFDNNKIKRDDNNFGIPLCMTIYDVKVFTVVNGENSSCCFIVNKRSIQFNDLFVKNAIHSDIMIDYDFADMRINIIKKILNNIGYKSIIIINKDKYKLIFNVNKKYFTVQSDLKSSIYTFENVCKKMQSEQEPHVNQIIEYVLGDADYFL